MHTDRLPTARELEALKVLWDHGHATVRDIYDRIRDSRTDDIAYTTVLSLMQSMEKKGLVGREAGGRGKTHHYFAILESESTLRSLAGNFLETVFEGALDQYLVRALESRSASIEELQQMEQMIAEAKRRQQGERDTPEDD